MSRRLSSWSLGWRLFVAPGSSRRLLSSSFAMALGLIPLVLVLSIADGMIDAISARTIETSLFHARLWPLALGDEDPFRSKAALEGRLKKVAGLRGIWEEQPGFALAYASEGRRLGMTLRGVEGDWISQDTGAARYLRAVSGTMTFPTPKSVWIGQAAAEVLGVHPGDTLKLMTTLSRGSLTVPRVTDVTVAAVVSVGYQELDRLWLFLPLPLAQSLVGPGDATPFWGIKWNAPLSKTADMIEAIRKAAGPLWQVESWQESGRSQFLNYQATRTLLTVILALVLLVAGVNVSTAMIMTVAERRQETAILKALGASDRLIQGQFLAVGFFSGAAGTVFGLVAGMVLALSINTIIQAIDAAVSFVSSGPSFHLLNQAYYLQSIPVHFDPVTLLLSVAGALVLALLACWWPARQAARSRPLEVLRRV